MIQIPRVGSRIRVTTRFPNHYYKTYKESPFEFFTYEGTVLPLDSKNPTDSFNLTGDGTLHVRNISLSNISDLIVLKGSVVTRKIVDSVRAFRVKSKSKNREYVVTVSGNKYKCTCVGFQYHRYCKHTKAVFHKVEKDVK